MIRLATIAVLIAAVLIAGCAAKPSKPNIVVIVTDDAGYNDYGFSGAGVVPTPAIDRIANEGVVFTQGYVTASVCSPSRAGLLAGRYQQRFGHEFNLGHPDESAGLGFPAEEPAIAEILSDHGYVTAAFGKWHLGTAPGLQPLDQGFDEFHGILEGSRTYFALEPDATRGVLRRGRDQITEPTDLYLTDWIADESIAYVERHHDADTKTPYFMYVSFTAPHTPMHARDDDLTWVNDNLPQETSERRKLYAAMTRSLDRSVGELLDTLDEVGDTKNTMVFFINDNGGATNNGSDNGTLRGMKGSKWEGGIRVPFAARWPAKIAPGTTFDPPTSSLDIAASSLAAAGAPVQEQSTLDGTDLIPFITGRADGAPHSTLFWRRGVAAAVRHGDWKLIRVQNAEPLLFNLADDSSETTNLAANDPQRVQELLTRLAAWEADLAEPAWREGKKWERFQLRKHQMDVIGREAERRYP